MKKTTQVTRTKRGTKIVQKQHHTKNDLRMVNARNKHALQMAQVNNANYQAELTKRTQAANKTALGASVSMSAGTTAAMMAPEVVIEKREKDSPSKQLSDGGAVSTGDSNYIGPF